MEIILDTNFIVTALREKIPFLDDLRDMMPYAEIVVPEQVIVELEKAGDSSKLKIKDREAAVLGLQLVKDIRKISLEKRYVDKGILEYAKNNPEVYVATLDRELKEQLDRVITIRGNKKIIIS